MPAQSLPKSVVIIGAGPAGLFAARRLRQLGVKDITLIEREDVVGGKCSTYKDPQNSSQIAERGAVVIAPNYGEVIDALNEKGIKTERTLSAKSDTVEIVDKADHINFFQKIQLGGQFTGEIYRFNKAVKLYRKCCANLQQLPEDLKSPFAAFAEKYRLENINLLLKPFVAGFGYGDMKDCPTYSVLEYMGYMTLPFLIAQHYGFQSCELRSIEGGFQHLMQRLAEDFKVITSAKIQHVNRKGLRVSVDFTTKINASQTQTIEADALVLAISPFHWESLFGQENLTAIEQRCVEDLTFYRYPVVICRLHGLPQNYVYKPEMLNREHFGHVAFVSTLDKREKPADGRLCSAYINQLPNHIKGNDLHVDGLELRSIMADLRSLPGVTNVEIIECKIWEDYFPTLPWDVRLDLEKQQYAASTRTLYAGGYVLGSFEDVACIANSTTQLINRRFGVSDNATPSLFKEIKRFFQRP